MSSHWISLDSSRRHPVSAFKRCFDLVEDSSLLFRVSADERYILYLDGQPIGRGPARGLPEHWSIKEYTVRLSKGRHVCVALVWSMGEDAPMAQESLQQGFYLEHLAKPDQPDLSTGAGGWTGRDVAGVSFQDLGGRVEAYYAVGADCVVDGREYPFGLERGECSAWEPVRSVPDEPLPYSAHGECQAHRILCETGLPEMYVTPWKKMTLRAAVGLSPGRPIDTMPLVAEAAAMDRFRPWLEAGRSLTLPAESSWRVIIDLEDYVCAYPELVAASTSTGVVTLRWAESLYEDFKGTRKGDRNAVSGKYFIGRGDRFIVAKAEPQRYATLWWRAGRFLELNIQVGETDLNLKSLSLLETGYPYSRDSAFRCEDPRYAALHHIADRSLQACSHETYVDCPYYEQLMYAGDTRLDMLTHYTTTESAALQKHALELFDLSRDRSGVTACRVPGRLRQVIPPFSFLWVNGVHDFACWRKDSAYVARRLPGVRAVVEYGLNHLGGHGLVDGLAGWNFIDWVDGWDSGVPPGLEQGPSALVNWQFLHALQAAVELEGWIGDAELAERFGRYANALAEQLVERYWSIERGLFADDLAHSSFSEHGQSLAVLSGTLDDSKLASIRRNWLRSDDLAAASIYFSHYVLEACRALGLEQAFYERLNFWLELPAEGFSTTPESPEPTRSDCHAWGAHPLYHAYASQLGIRPDGFGFERVRIQPMPGDLAEMAGEMIHPAGKIAVSMERGPDTTEFTVTLPVGLSGRFLWRGEWRQLSPGEQILKFRDGNEPASVPGGNV